MELVMALHLSQHNGETPLWGGTTLDMCVCCCWELINKQSLCCLKSKPYFVLTYTFLHLFPFIGHHCLCFNTKRNINGHLLIVAEDFPCFRKLVQLKYMHWHKLHFKICHVKSSLHTSEVFNLNSSCKMFASTRWVTSVLVYCTCSLMKILL